MDIEWKYKMDLTDEHVFSEIEEAYGISFPEDLKEFIRISNASNPSKYHFLVGSYERVLGGILSFNHDGPDPVFDVLFLLRDMSILPFGVDPFDNYICYDLKSKEVVFWNHETNNITSTGKGLKSFIESLY